MNQVVIETITDEAVVRSSPDAPDAPLTCMSSEIDGVYYGYVAMVVFSLAKVNSFSVKSAFDGIFVRKFSNGPR